MKFLKLIKCLIFLLFIFSSCTEAFTLKKKSEAEYKKLNKENNSEESKETANENSKPQKDSGKENIFKTLTDLKNTGKKVGNDLTNLFNPNNLKETAGNFLEKHGEKLQERNEDGTLKEEKEDNIQKK